MGKAIASLKKYFNRADKDGDGEISKADWYEALKAAQFHVTMEDVDKVFEEHDKDLDGKLSWEEFSGEETKNEKAFKLMDMDHNGKVSKEEFRNFCQALSTRQVAAAFKKFDISGDDELDYEEFCKLMNNRDKKKAKKRDEEREIKKKEEEKLSNEKEKRKDSKRRPRTKDKEKEYDIKRELYS